MYFIVVFPMNDNTYIGDSIQQQDKKLRSTTLAPAYCKYVNQ